MTAGFVDDQSMFLYRMTVIMFNASITYTLQFTLCAKSHGILTLVCDLIAYDSLQHLILLLGVLRCHGYHSHGHVMGMCGMLVRLFSMQPMLISSDQAKLLSLLSATITSSASLVQTRRYANCAGWSYQPLLVFKKEKKNQIHRVISTHSC